MSEERKPRSPPFRALHEFLIEISNEWNRFRNDSLLSIMSIITTLILFVLFVPRYFLLILRQQGHFNTIIALGIIIALLYNIYLSYLKHQFYQS